jgi:hypothetical protein
MDKLTELLTAMFVTLAGTLAFISKRLFKRVDDAHERIDSMEKKIVDRHFLENQLGPMRSDINLILKTLLRKDK